MSRMRIYQLGKMVRWRQAASAQERPHGRPLSLPRAYAFDGALSLRSLVHRNERTNYTHKYKVYLK